MKRRAIGAQHVDGGDHHAPEREERSRSEKCESGCMSAPFRNAPKKTMISPAKFAKPGRPIDAKAPMPKAKPANGMTFAESAEIFEQQACRCVAAFHRQWRKAARSRVRARTSASRRRSYPRMLRARDSEKDVAHVHHARIAEHPIEPLLRDRDQADVDDIAEQEDDEQPGPVLRAFRQAAEARCRSRP